MSAAHEVALSADALGDIARLDDFLRAKSPSAADRMLVGFEEAFERLAQMPRLGRSVAAQPEREIRELIVRFARGSYVLRYEVRPGLVLIARVHHTREDRP